MKTIKLIIIIFFSYKIVYNTTVFLIHSIIPELVINNIKKQFHSKYSKYYNPVLSIINKIDDILTNIKFYLLPIYIILIIFLLTPDNNKKI